MTRLGVRRIVFALAIAPLLAAGAAAAAGPKGAAPKSSATPSAAPKTPKVTAMTAVKMALIPPATKEFKAATARAASIQIEPGDLKTATRMTVRQPSADISTALAFVRPETVMPRGGDGIATMNPGLPAQALTGFDFSKFAHGDPTAATTTQSEALSSMGVAFRASANRSYVVTCTFDGAGRFVASILENSNAAGATSELVPARASDGHVGAAVLAAPRLRDLTVQFSSDAAWTSSSCEITPVG